MQVAVVLVIMGVLVVPTIGQLSYLGEMISVLGLLKERSPVLPLVRYHT